MAVGIGSMDRRITLKGYTSAADAYGQMVKTWATGSVVWAAVEVVSGTEGQDNQAELSRRRLKFTIRYKSGVDETYRIVYEGNDYDIISVAEIGRRRYMEIIATVRDA